MISPRAREEGTLAKIPGGTSGGTSWGGTHPAHKLAAPPHYLSDGSGRDTYAFATARAQKFDFDASLRTALPLPPPQPRSQTAARTSRNFFAETRIPPADPASKSELKAQFVSQKSTSLRLSLPKSPERLARLSPERMRFSYSTDRLEAKLADTIYSAPTYQSWGSDSRSFLSAKHKQWIGK